MQLIGHGANNSLIAEHAAKSNRWNGPFYRNAMDSVPQRFYKLLTTVIPEWYKHGRAFVVTTEIS